MTKNFIKKLFKGEKKLLLKKDLKYIKLSKLITIKDLIQIFKNDEELSVYIDLDL